MISEHIKTQIYSNFRFETTNGQKKVIESLAEYVSMNNNQSILLINGYAGTGKTSIIASLIATLRQMKIESVLLAPTGRAAKVMGNYASSKAYTIHKKIYRQKSLTSEVASFSLDINKHKNTFFIVDEASMLSNYSADGNAFGSGMLLDDLVTYVRSGFNCKLIIVGDTAQLPPIGAELSPALDPLYMGRYGDIMSVSMDDIVRHASDSGILYNASMVRCMLEEGIIDVPLFETHFPDVRSINGGEFIEEISSCYDKYGIEDTLVITRSNKRANQFNQGVRNHVLFHEDRICTGDMVMVVKNNYHYTEKDKDSPVDFIANGDVARISRIKKYEEMHGFQYANVTLTFVDYDNMELDCKIILDAIDSESPSLTYDQHMSLFRSVEQDYMNLKTKRKRYDAIREDPYFNALQVKFAYAVTCHKSQGGQWKSVFVDRLLFGEEEMTKDFMRWLYTAITRATEKLYFVNFDSRFFADKP